jgi:hypothetical protein
LLGWLVNSKSTGDGLRQQTPVERAALLVDCGYLGKRAG